MLKKLPALFLFSIVSFAVGFANQLLISKYFGTSSSLDAYWFFIALINFLGFYAFPLRDAVSPLFFKELRESRNATHLASSAVSLCVYIAVGEILVLAFFLFTSQSDFLPNYFQISSDVFQMLLWLLPSILLIAVIEVMSGLLLSLNMPIEQAICRLIAPCITFFCLLMFAEIWGEIALAFSFSLANLLVMGISLMYLHRANIKITLSSPKPLFQSSIKSMFWMMTLVYVFAQLHAFYERFVFLQFGPGVISGFQYAFMLVTTLIGLIAGPICNLLWPYFMAINHKDGSQDQSRVIDSLWVYLGAPLLVIAIFIFYNAHAIVYFLFYRGEFNIESAQITSNALMLLIFAIIPACMSQVIVRLLNAQNNYYGIGAVGITMACTGITLLTISMIQQNLDLAMSQWLIANFVGASLCMLAGYWRVGIKLFLTSSRLKLLLKLALITLIAFYFAPKVSISDSKIILGFDLLISSITYMVPLFLGLIYLNHSYFPFIKLPFKR